MLKEVTYNSDDTFPSLKSNDILLPNAGNLVETHTCYSSSKDYMLGNYQEYLKPGLSLSDFKADIDLI